VGSIQDLDAGRPVRVRSCGGVALPAGPARLTMAPAALAPYILRLHSGTPPAPAAAPGRVLSGDDEHARLRVRAPGRLVLAEAYTSGRRASCDGHDLGTPRIGDGFGTAWNVPAGCRDVTFSFAPDRLVRAGYLVSAVAGLALLALLLLRRAPRRGEERVGGDEPRVVRLPAGRAALVALPVALGLGFVFAARGTPLFFAGVFVVLWRGIGARRLALAAGALLVVVVPVLTLLEPVRNRGGYNPEYADKRILVHWAAVAAVTLLILALARVLSTARGRRGRAPAARPSGAARRRSAP
jgi:hypothetical protein